MRIVEAELPMNRAVVVLGTVLAIVSLAPFAAAGAPQTDPASVLKSLFEARNSANADAALALFADDGVIINVVGAKFAGRDNIKKFLDGAAAQKGRYDLEEVRSVGETVTWTDLVTNPLYEKLDIAPVQVAGQAVIREGKISSFITHFPPNSLAKFEQVCEPACEEPKAGGVLIVGLPCPQFLQNAKAQMRRSMSQ
jgi:hypothetical protein